MKLALGSVSKGKPRHNSSARVNSKTESESVEEDVESFQHYGRVGESETKIPSRASHRRLPGPSVSVKSYVPRAARPFSLTLTHTRTQRASHMPTYSHRACTHRWPPTAVDQTRAEVSTTRKCNSSRRIR